MPIMPTKMMPLDIRRAGDLLGLSSTVACLSNGAPAHRAGSGSAEARATTPTSSAGAERVLNAARANLAAYREWSESEAARQEKVAEQAKADAAAFKKKQVRRRALEAYNAHNKTNFKSWELACANAALIDSWIALVEQIDGSKTVQTITSGLMFDPAISHLYTSYDGYTSSRVF